MTGIYRGGNVLQKHDHDKGTTRHEILHGFAMANDYYIFVLNLSLKLFCYLFRM